MDATLSLLVLKNFIGFSRFFEKIIIVSWFHYFPFYLVSQNFICFSRFFDALCVFHTSSLRTLRRLKLWKQDRNQSLTCVVIKEILLEVQCTLG